MFLQLQSPVATLYQYYFNLHDRWEVLDVRCTQKHPCGKTQLKCQNWEIYKKNMVLRCKHEGLFIQNFDYQLCIICKPPPEKIGWALSLQIFKNETMLWWNINCSVKCVWFSFVSFYTTRFNTISSVKKNINYHHIQKLYKIALAFAKKPRDTIIMQKNHKKSTYRIQSQRRKWW